MQAFKQAIGFPPRGPLSSIVQCNKKIKEYEMKYVAGLFDWLSSGIAEGERMRREAYLAQASDHCDLEYRMQALERDAVLARGLW